jgi:hypothetical protein
MMRIAAAIATAALLGIGAAQAASPPATTLAIAFYPKGMAQPDVIRYRLRCNPATGTVPQPALACRTLASLAHPFAPTPPGTFCTALAMGPEEAIVTGRLRGARVWAHLRVQGGCEINRWRRVANVVPGFPNR